MFFSIPKQLANSQRKLLHAATLIVCSYDADLYVHSRRVACDLLHLAPKGCEEVWFWAGFLHDVGKVGLPVEILYKPGALTHEEKHVMQQHPMRGAAMLKRMGAPQAVVEGAKFHHERWDGTGYPCDIYRQQIPYIARVLAVADAYAVLTSARPYHHALTSVRAFREIKRNAGSQFDPQIVKRFFKERQHDTR